MSHDLWFKFFSDFSFSICITFESALACIASFVKVSILSFNVNSVCILTVTLPSELNPRIKCGIAVPKLSTFIVIPYSWQYSSGWTQWYDVYTWCIKVYQVFDFTVLYKWLYMKSPYAISYVIYLLSNIKWCRTILKRF